MMTTSTSSKSKRQGAKNVKPEFDPYAVMAFFVARRSSLTRFARLHGYVPQIAHFAVRGQRRGPRAQSFLAILRKEMAK